MNKARQSYLGMYGKVDQGNAKISSIDLGIKLMKFWHSALDYGFSLALVQIYDFYIDGCTGKPDEEWAVDKSKIRPLRNFMLELSQQMLEYSPHNHQYPGDSNKRNVTRKPKSRRKKKKRKCHVPPTVPLGFPTQEQFLDAVVEPNSRFCMDIGAIWEH